jgi:hypothetical protein
MRNEPDPSIEAAFLNAKNAAKYMGISVNTLYPRFFRGCECMTGSPVRPFCSA